MQQRREQDYRTDYYYTGHNRPLGKAVGEGGQKRKGKEEVLVLEGEEGPVAAFVLFLSLSLSSHFRPPTNRPMDGGAFLSLPPTVGSRGFGRTRAV